MKIKDIVQESVYDWFTQRDAARIQATSQQADRNNTYAKAVANIGPKIPQPQQSPQGHPVLDPEVKVIKAVDPVILQFNGKRYTVQPNGQWTKLGQTKPVDLPTQQFLSSELAKL